MPVRMLDWNRLLAWLGKQTPLLLSLAFYFVICLLLLRVGGASFEYAPARCWQLLDPGLLRNGLLQSLWYLHSQPPIFNLVFGVCLKAEGILGVPVEQLLLMINLALGAGTVAGYVLASEALLGRRLLFWVFLGAVVLNPSLYNNVLVHHYTIYELFYLSVSVLLIVRLAARPSLRKYLFVCLLVAALVYTRSLFHPVPMLAVLLCAGILAGISDPSSRQRFRYLAIYLATALVLLAWPMKNWAVFGTFSYSSWMGFNLKRLLPIEPVPFSSVFLEVHDPPDEKTLAALQESVPRHLRAVPAVTHLRKGSLINYNHYAVLPVSKQFQEEAFELLLRHPSAYFKRILIHYYQTMMWSGRDSVSRRILMVGKSRGERVWKQAYESVLFHFYGSVPPDYYAASSLFFTMPVILLLSVRKLYQGRHRRSVAWWSVLYMIAMVCYVLAIILLIDGFEGNRMRISTEPFLFLICAWLFSREEPPVPA